MSKFFFILCTMLFFNVNTVKAQNFSTHQVKKGETIEAIAEKYYVTPADIYTLNPDAKKELKPNTVLIIPISKAKKPNITTVKELQGFKEHKVKKRETMYSLSKEYNVSEEEIKKYNTSLYSNALRKGDKIQIPIYKSTEVVEVIRSTKKYLVQPKEGKWRIAYKFGITVKDLESLNPGMAEVLKDGEEILVPNIDSKEENKVDEKYNYYKVLPKEGFYRLKLKLGLEQADLEALNPVLKEGGLKEGMVLKIPFSSKFSEFNNQEREGVDLSDSIRSFKTKRIAVMLPFRLNRINFDSIPEVKKSINKDAYLSASLDFYSGVLMAVDSLKNLGISIKLDVYDTKYDVGEVSRIINDNNFKNVDAVIGPLTPNTFEKAASELKALNIPIISPIGTNLNLYENVFQSRPSDELLNSMMMNFVKSDSTVNNIVVVADSKNVNVSNTLKREFAGARQVYSRKNKNGKDENYVLVDDLRSLLKPGKNIVFLETQSEGFASNVTSILASLKQNENIEEKQAGIEIILATTNYNMAFQGDEVSNQHLSKLQFHYTTTSKPYNDNEHGIFLKKYDAMYHISPDNRAIKGFDLTMDVVLRLVSSENLYSSVENAPLTEYIENKYAYKKKLFGGYYNDTAYLVKYQDLTIVEVKQ